MNVVLTIYFGLAASVAALISLWHLGYFLRHRHWNNVTMSTSEDNESMPGWVISLAFALLAVASVYGALLCSKLG